MGILKNIAKVFIPEALKSKYRKYKKEKPYIGDAVFCPVCKSKYRIFAPFGRISRDNATCLNCGSQERHRLLWLFLNNKTDMFKGKKIKLLHFAPEKIFYDVFSEDANIEYYPCDLFPDSFNYNGKTKISKADITDIPFADGTFDAIICNHVLEHIPDDIKAMKELKRVLKSNGWAILQVPIDYNLDKTYEDFSITSPEEREKAFGQYDHVRWYGKDYKDRLASAGFNVQEVDYVGEFSSDDIFKYGLMRKERVYYCKG